MRNLFIILAMAIVIVFVAVGITNLVSSDNQIKVQEVRLQDKNKQIEELELKNKQSVEKNTEQIEKLKKEKEDLEKQLQAKVEAKEKLAQATTLSQNVSAASVSRPSGTCEEWMTQAGITHPLARDLISRESGCNPCAYNPGQSDCNYQGNMACGIPQALPCSKLRDVAGCAMTDAVCQLRWMQDYVSARYGTWENAIAFHNANNWY